ncbi:MAG: flagellar basal body P-ring protein FlgI [Hyphomicrobiales bacterium]|nr:flagellar basal body P-ring protein FlgI [Hyphomicrobiales bacterium]
MKRLILTLLFCALAGHALAAVRIKDITSLRGAQDNQLIGYGLVVGLQGSGDTMQNSPFTQQALQSMLDHLGVNVRGATLRNRNLAAVIVTAEMPIGLAVGSRIDVTVSALGDAPSLMGGTLVMTQLTGADGQVYASAQGAVAVTGFDVAGQAETLSQGVPTAGHIANGAIIERPIPAPPDPLRMTLELTNPDYNTAVRIVDAINAYSQQRFGRRSAFEMDGHAVELFRPATMSATRYMAEIGELPVEPDTPARVVVDSRTGTVVIGQDVQISTVGVTYGTLSVRVNETPIASQPNPLSRGTTVVLPRTQIDVEQPGGQVAIVNGSSLRMLVNGLNRIGVKPSGVIAILQAIKTAGALQADLVVQ